MTELRSIDPARVAGGLGEKVLSSARYCVDSTSDVVAFAMIALHADGSTDVAGMVGDDAPFPRYMFIGHCTEILRDHFITDVTARDVVNRANGFED